MPKKKKTYRHQKNQLKLIQRVEGGKWIMRGTLNGKRIEKSTDVYDKELARDIMIQFESELLDEKVYGKKATITFKEAAEDYLENSPKKGGSNRRHVLKLIEWIPNEKLKDLNSKRVHQLVKKHYPGRSGSTTNTHFINPIVTVMRFAAESGDCDAPVIRKMPNDSKVVKAPPRGWEVEFVNRCSPDRPRVKALVAFMTTTGMRCVTCLRTTWEQIDWERERIVYDGIQLKNGDALVVELAPNVMDMLREIDQAPDRHWKGPFANYSRTDVAGREIAKECKRLGMEVYTPHVIGRHAFAERMLNAGYTLQEVADMGGWKDLKVLREKYGHLEQKRIRRIVRDEAAKLFRSGLKVVGND